MFVDYVLPVLVVIGLVGVVYVLIKDNSVDVTGSDIHDDKPSPPRPFPPSEPSDPIEISKAQKQKKEDLSEMSKTQLIKLATSKGIKVNSRMRKDQIVKKLL